ncbi:hypothetical protein JCM11251_000842 [Rhodosporidiobolus azoricus]
MYGVPLPPPRQPTAPPPPRFEEVDPTTSSIADGSATALSGDASNARSSGIAKTSTGRRRPAPAKTEDSWVRRTTQDLLKNPLALFTDRRYFWLVATGLLAWEGAVCVAIVLKVRYTEIDFSTYLQQAEHFINGQRDYSQIRGESGPCYYPATHLYLYSFLYYLVRPVFGMVDGVPARIVGGHLQLAQFAFGGVYVLSLGLVFVLYSRNSSLPQYLLPLLCISKRLHSIYVLRMFNDALAMLFLYAALVLYTDLSGSKRAVRWKWVWGTLLFSLALNTKMSILLFLPALLYLLFVYHSPITCLFHTLLLLTTQILLALPFVLPTTESLSPLLKLLAVLPFSPSSVSALHTALEPARVYFAQGYSLSRSFLYEFTVNWRWLQDEELFLSSGFAQALMVAHVVGLGLFAIRWAEEEGGVVELLTRGLRRPMSRPAKRELTAERATTLFFTSNYIGVLCARSLHPQFYAWIAWQGVWLVFGAAKGVWEGIQRFLLLSLLEYAFATYPSTTNSSLGLVVSLLVILTGVYYGRACGEPKAEQPWQAEPGEVEGDKAKRE